MKKPFSGREVRPGMILKYQKPGDPGFLCLVLRLSHGTNYHNCSIYWVSKNPFGYRQTGQVSFCDARFWEILS
jgi:hypothetical protein